MARLKRNRQYTAPSRKTKAFTLVELLVVISVTSVMMSILLPVLAAARDEARSVFCQSNIRQLFLANSAYADDNNAHYVPAAPDIYKYKGGNHRWHGTRDNPDETFDPNKGPLAPYLAQARIRMCPAFKEYARDETWNKSFEKGCGGYGYNRTYIGSRSWVGYQFTTFGQMNQANRRTTQITEIAQPSQTLMFADTAILNKNKNIIEYSFAEPPFYVYLGQPKQTLPLSPSIHFRHRSRANIVWADGHTGEKALEKTETNRLASAEFTYHRLGWFNPADNSPFDLK